MSDLFVDPTVLRELHDALTSLADQVDRFDPATGLYAVASALPTSAVAEAAGTPDTLIEAIGVVSGRIRELGFIAMGSHANYVATEEEIATGFASMGEF